MKGIPLALLAVLICMLFVSAPFAAIEGARAVTAANANITTPSALYRNITVANNSSANLPAPNFNISLARLDLVSAAGDILSPALSYALMTGQYAYAISKGNIIVMDTSKREIISTIKPMEKDSRITAVAVSPDGKFIYAAAAWTIYTSDSLGGYTSYYSRVARLNASTQAPIDYFQVDKIRPEHLAVSPDGRVYLGFQQGGYPDHAGVGIYDFAQGKSWYIDYNTAFIIQNFEFAQNGNKVYYAGWYDYPGVYELDWGTNKVHYNKMPGNISNGYEYVRSIATAKGGSALYTIVNRNTGIVAMNTANKQMQYITTEYVPVAMASSKDGETLYVIGYFYDSNDKPIYLIHKYSGLNAVEPEGIFDIIISTKQAFQYDALTYVAPPAGDYPSRMAVSADGKYGYIITSSGDGVNSDGGDGIIVYDLEYMNQVKIISGKEMQSDIAISSEKILYSPPVDFGYIQQFSPNLPMLGLSDNYTYAKKFYPEKGSFAKDYAQEFFVVYAAFTDTLDNSTVNNSTFWLTEKTGAVVSGKARAASAIAIFSPAEQLKADTDYVAHLSKSIKGKKGNPLYADVTWDFTTKNTSAQGSAQSPNSTLNFSFVKAISAVSAMLSLPLEAQNNSSESNKSRSWLVDNGSALNKLPGALSDWARKGAQFGNNTSSGNDDSTGNEPEKLGEEGWQTSPKNESAEMNGDGNGASNGNGLETGTTGAEGAEDVKKSVDDAKKATELNPQPEPPAPASPSSGQESPAQQKGFFEGIIEFFKSLIGWK